MKSIEEKAKAYDEAIKRLEDIKTGKCQKTFVFTEGLFDYIFPELKESEDEKIRKEILDYIIKGSESLYDVQQYGKERFEKWIAWLEKKPSLLTKEKALKNSPFVEQKPIDKVEPKFKVGDIIKPKCYNETHSIKAIGERYYILDVDIKIPFRYEDDWELVEQKSSWSEKDETVLNNLIYALANDRIGNDRDEYISWLKSLKERYTWKPSDEQMDALYTYIYNPQYFNSPDLRMELVESVYQDLKKLKG